MMRRDHRVGKESEPCGPSQHSSICLACFSRSFPGDDPAPSVRCDTLRVRVAQMEMLTEGGTRFRVQNWVLDLALPARLRESGFRPYAEAEAHLSQDQRL